MVEENSSGRVFDVPGGCKQDDSFGLGQMEDVVHGVTCRWLIELPLVAMLKLGETITLVAVPRTQFCRWGDVFEPLVETRSTFRYTTRP